jgi:membrane associated rhomboid family serine protease
VIPLRDANPTRRPAVLTFLLIAACILTFLYEWSLQGRGGEEALFRFFLEYGVVPRDLTAALGRGDLLSGEVAAIATSMFLHGGWLHLGGNMLYLWIFGNNIEDRLGRPIFLLFYLAGGVVAALTQVVIAPESRVPLVGASGAIAAVLGMYFVLYPSARVQSLVFLGFFVSLVAVPAVIVLGLWFVLQLLPGFASLGADDAASGGVAFFAHIGGFVMGMACGLLARARPGAQRRMG